MAKAKTKEELLESYHKKHGDFYDYSLVEIKETGYNLITIWERDFYAKTSR